MSKIYLDNAATTKPNAEFFEQAKVFALENYYNPSALYREGRAVSDELKRARMRILSAFKGYDAVFTSCGTEADNMAIFGFSRRGNVVTTLGEHSAVFESFEALKNKGFDVRYAKLNKDGSVDVEDLLSLVDENTTFCSVVHVNNETGAINDVNMIAERAKSIAKRLVFHSDGVQAFGKIKSGFGGNVDLYSVSAHKIGGIKGVGCLLVRSGLHVPPYIIGGGQENGLRSGTENVLGIVDFSLCANSAFCCIDEHFERAKKLKEEFVAKLSHDKIAVISSHNASPYVISLCAESLRGEVVQHMLEDEGVIVGTGSACSSKHPHSRVLRACGYSSKQLDGILRVSFSFDTTSEEVAFAAQKINACVSKLNEVIG